LNVYRVQHVASGKNYIGKNSHSDPEHRWKDHQKEAFNPRCSMYNSHFYRALRKYGPEAFEFSSLIFTNTLETLAELESENIRQFRSNDPAFGFNSSTGGEAVSYNAIARKHMSEAQKKIWDSSPQRKLDMARRGEECNLFGVNRIGENNPFFGQKHSPENLPRVRRNAALGRHVRWHVNKGIQGDDCEFCATKQSSLSTISEGCVGSL